MNGNSSIFGERKVVRLTWPEIILTVLLIMVLEGLVFYLSAMHSGSVSAMNYVSFAGTITSIILAVVAIIYTMIESLRQSTTTDKMVNGAISVQQSAQEIAAEVQNLKDLRERITETSRAVKDVSDKLDNKMFSGETDKIFVEKDNFPTKILNHDTLDDIIPTLVSSHFYLGPIYASLAYLIVKESTRLNDVFLNKNLC